MRKLKIAVFLGSLRKDSYNKKLALEAIRMSSDTMDFEFIDLESMPHFNEDLEDDFPASATKAKEIVDESDGVLFVSPEYNHSLPGFLKNGIDWISRPGNGNRTSFSEKPAAVMGASTSRTGTARMQLIIRDLFASQNMIGMNKPMLLMAEAPKYFTPDDKLKEPFDRLVKNFMESFEMWIYTQSAG